MNSRKLIGAVFFLGWLPPLWEHMPLEDTMLSFQKTYSTPGFTESFFYPYPLDNEGGPSSKLIIGWHYVNVQGG